MSSASQSYVYYVEAATRYIEDAEIKDLILDTAKLLRDVEWFTDCINDPVQVEESIYKFRHKWFGTSRNERLKEYIVEALEMVKEDMISLIGNDKEEKLHAKATTGTNAAEDLEYTEGR